MSNESKTTSAELIGPGGNVVLSPGGGLPPGCIVFKLDDESEMIRFDHDGKVYVRGEEVDDNQEVYRHLRRWMRLAHIYCDEDVSIRHTTRVNGNALE